MGVQRLKQTEVGAHTGSSPVGGEAGRENMVYYLWGDNIIVLRQRDGD